MQEYHDYLPANTEIVVDYKKPPEERVKFDYAPSTLKLGYKKVLKKSAKATALLWWDSTLIISILTIFIVLFCFQTIGSLLARTILLAEAGISIIPVPISHSVFTLSNFINEMIPLLAIIAILLGIFAPGYLLYYWLIKDNGKNAAKWIPKINYISVRNLGLLKKARVYPSDMQEYGNKIMFKFSNVYLDYKTYGQFGEYLNKVEILGIPPSQFKKHSQLWNWKYRRLRKGEKITRRERSQYSFRCVFYFTQKPNTGYMDLVYH